MKISGLYQLISHKRKTAGWQRQKASFPRTDPHISHEAGVDAEQLEKEAARLEGQVRSNEALIPRIELLIHDLTTSSYRSADREHARQNLILASMLLRRELGDKEERPTSNVERRTLKEDND